MIQQLLAQSRPLAGHLLLSASMLELPPLLLVHSLPEIQHALPTCHHAEKNISFTSKTHVTSSHREPQAFKIIVKSLSFGGNIFSDMHFCLSRHEHAQTANVRARITSFNDYSKIYRDCPAVIKV